MRRGAVSGRASAAALALVLLSPVVGVAPAAAADATPGVSPDATDTTIVLPPRARRDAAPVGAATAGDEVPSSDAQAVVDARRAAERAEADPLATLEAELAAADGAYDGFLVVVAEVGLLDHLRSLLTRGRPADPLERGADRVRAVGGSVEGELDGLLTAVVADLSEDEARVLALDPAVRWISPNALVSLGSRRIATDASHPNGPLVLWNLAVADSIASQWGAAGAYYGLLDRSYLHSSDGSGVDVYVLDSGIDVANLDVAAQVVPEAEFLPTGYYRIAGDTIEPDDDCNGHGTHVAGTVAGAASGVARRARLIPVKVFPDCERSTSYANIINGLSWVSDVIGAVPTRPAVVNMSLGGPASVALDEAVAALIGTVAAPRVTVIVAGGNENVNVSGVSPARVADAITVGALGNLECLNAECSSVAFYYDERASYSNYGVGVDIMAPGSNTWSACAATNRLTAVVDANGDVTGYVQKACSAVPIDGVTYQLTALNGTSMAAPFVAGLAARYLGERLAADGSVATPAEVRAALVGGALTGVLTEAYISLGGSPNLVANARFLEPAPSAPPVPVVVACTGGAAASGLLQLPDEGVGPFTWSVTAGTLPDGLTLSTDGRITGSTTPATQIGTVTLQVEDPFGRTASATLGRSAFPAGCTG